MIDFIKKGMLASLGAAVITKEKTEAALNDLVEKGKISRDEAKVASEKIVEEGRKEFDRFKEEAAKRMSELLHKSNLVTREQYEALEARVQKLEAELASRKNDA